MLNHPLRLATGSHAAAYAANARLTHARAAIAAWHRICETTPQQPQACIVESAYAQMTAKV